MSDLTRRRGTAVRRLREFTRGPHILWECLDCCCTWSSSEMINCPYCALSTPLISPRNGACTGAGAEGKATESSSQETLSCDDGSG